MARILLIEDDETVRGLLVQMLSDAGFEVAQATNGEQGIELYRKTPTDLIITDLVMPEKEGIEVITELRRDFPDVKIIAISGGGRQGGDGYLKIAKMLGAKRTLNKPFSLKSLLEAIQEVLKQP